MIIEFHASNTGWGAWQADRGLLVNEQGLKPYQLPRAAGSVSSSTMLRETEAILLKMDNVTAVTYINKMGGTQSEGLCQLALTIWNWCLHQNIFLITEYLTVADEESRNMEDCCNWMLNPLIFRQIQEQMGPLEKTCSHLI